MEDYLNFLSENNAILSQDISLAKSSVSKISYCLSHGDLFDFWSGLFAQNKYEEFERQQTDASLLKTYLHLLEVSFSQKNIDQIISLCSVFNFFMLADK